MLRMCYCSDSTCAKAQREAENFALLFGSQKSKTNKDKGKAKEDPEEIDEDDDEDARFKKKEVNVQLLSGLPCTRL
jgi:hypothetical protein